MTTTKCSDNALPFIYPNWDAPENVVAFTTLRNGGTSSPPYDTLNLGYHVGDNPDNVRKNRSLLPYGSDTYWMNQVHGDVVCLIGAASSKEINGVDALIARQQNQFCAVMTADCVPILLASRTQQEVAAVHAGWKGLANGIVASTINAMQSRPEDVVAWIGPCICKTCYEVDKPVISQISAELANNAQLKLLAHSEDWLELKSNGKYWLDLVDLASQQLYLLGVTSVFKSGICTRCEPERFYSHRGTTLQGGSHCGRFASIIGIV